MAGEAFEKGQRVRSFRGKAGTVQGTGTVYAYYGPEWQTVGVEFDDDKGVIVQVLKEDLIKITDVVTASGKVVGSLPEGYEELPLDSPYIHKDVEIVPWSVRLGDIDVHRLGDGSMQLNIHNRSDDKVAEVKASASAMAEFALRILQQTTYVLQDKEK